MIRLGTDPEPRWLDLTPHLRGDHVRVFVRPLDFATYQAAQIQASRRGFEVLQDARRVIEAGGTVDGLPDPDDSAGVAGFSQALFAEGLAQAAIIRWEGVGDAAGEPVGPTPENIRLLLRIPRIADEFLTQYAAVWDEAFAEGNGSAPLPNGISVGARNTARAAAATASPAPEANADGMDDDVRIGGTD